MNSITDLEAAKFRQFQEPAVCRLKQHTLYPLNQRSTFVETGEIGRTDRWTIRATDGGGIGWATRAVAEIGSAFKQTLLHTQFEAIRNGRIRHCKTTRAERRGLAIDDIAADTQEWNTHGSEAEIGRNLETGAIRKATGTDVAFAEMPNGDAGLVRFTGIAVCVVVAPANRIVKG